MRALAFVTLCLAALIATAAEHPDEYYDPDVQHLMSVQGFAFGPTGPVNRPSAGEQAFAAIVQKPQAIRCMLQVFDHGTAEAKCYALVALREYSTELFVSAGTSFRLDQMPEIRVIDGETIRAVPATKVLDDIRRGRYQKYFRKYEDETN